ncbi:MAG TPA: histidinol-phosphate transaminase [Chloroflexota bacterium]|nr:histidinol-phosphate transaminase [Chloroflexota bacterium]
MTWIRPNVEALQPYVPGEQPQEPGWIKLNTNENPFLAPAVIDAVAEAVGDTLRLYPDPECRALREALGRRYGFPPAQIICGNGSDELLTLAVRAAVGEGDRVVFPDPSYSLYQTLAQIQHAMPLPVALGPQWELPVESLVAAGGRLTLVANPNAPTGTPYRLQELDALAGGVPGLLLIDEAYVDFGGETALPLLERHENVLVLRTMSKAFGLAGVRLGYAFGTPATIIALRKVQDSYPVDRLTQEAAVAALGAYEAAMDQNRELAARRDRYAALLRDRWGWRVWPSAANFFLVETTGHPAREIFEGLKARRILVRYFTGHPRLEGSLRISVGAEAEMDALVEALEGMLG